MLGSQALETVIGLVLLFFVISLAASSFVETVSQLMKWRATNLERVLGEMLAGRSSTVSQLSPSERTAIGLPAEKPQGEGDRPLTPDETKKVDAAGAALAVFKGTSVYEALQAGSRRATPSYMSARAFTDSVAEMLDAGQGMLQSLDSLPQGLRRRLESAARRPVADATAKALAVRSDLEQWFDDAMARLEGAYKRWASRILFGVGLFLAVCTNASAFHVAERLWQEPATRAVVANAAPTVGAGETLADVAAAADRLESLGLPLGWDAEARRHWNVVVPRDATAVAMAAGWLATALLVMFGAPFWFDLLTRLVTLRGAGPKPPPAVDDPASATSRLDRAAPAMALAGSRSVTRFALPPETGTDDDDDDGQPRPKSGPPTVAHPSQAIADVFGLRSTLS